MDVMKARYFLEVAQYQSMTKAARNLHIAEPAISMAMKKLAEDVGFALFQKKGRNIELTEEGRKLYENMQPILNQLDNLPALIREEADGEYRTIHINVLACSKLTIDAICEYKKQHPEVLFSLSQEEQDGYWDICITSAPDKEARDEKVKLLTEQIYLAVAGGNERFGDSVQIDELRNQEMISPKKSTQFAMFTSAPCMHAGFQPRVVFESNDPESINELVDAGVGVAFWPEYSWGELKGNCRLLPIANCDMKRDIYAVRKDFAENSLYKQNFFDYLMERVAQVS